MFLKTILPKSSTYKVPNSYFGRLSMDGLTLCLFDIYSFDTEKKANPGSNTVKRNDYL